jgi:hypothetical protein
MPTGSHNINHKNISEVYNDEHGCLSFEKWIFAISMPQASRRFLLAAADLQRKSEGEVTNLLRGPDWGKK